MKNLLPQFKTFKVDDENSRMPRHSNWNPSQSDPSRIPYYLNSVMLPEVPKNYKEIKYYNVQPPNKRYLAIEEAYANDTDPSPLAQAERGVPDLPKINIEKQIREKKVVEDLQERNLRNSLHIWMKNNLAVDIDLFVQRDRQMLSQFVDKFGGIRVNAVSGGRKGVSPDISQVCSVFVTTCIRGIVQVTGNQEEKDFEFDAGPIGMEVETSSTRLICARVVPDSQAAERYGSILEAGILVAVNKVRVVTLTEFTRALALARTSGKVVLTLEIFRGDKGRSNAIKSHEFLKRNLKLKSTFSSLLKSGLDKDHQYGMELPSHQADEEQEDEDEEEGEANLGQGGELGEGAQLDVDVDTERADEITEVVGDEGKSRNGTPKSGRSAKSVKMSAKSSKSKSRKSPSASSKKSRKSTKDRKGGPQRKRRLTYQSDSEDDDEDDGDGESEDDQSTDEGNDEDADEGAVSKKSTKLKSPTKSVKSKGKMSEEEQKLNEDLQALRIDTLSPLKSTRSTSSDRPPQAISSKLKAIQSQRAKKLESIMSSAKKRIEVKEAAQSSKGSVPTVPNTPADSAPSTRAITPVDGDESMSPGVGFGMAPGAFGTFAKSAKLSISGAGASNSDDLGSPLRKEVRVSFSEGDDGMLTEVKIVRANNDSMPAKSKLEGFDSDTEEDQDKPPPPVEVVKEEISSPAEQPKIESDYDDDDDDRGKWDYATALEHAESVKFSRAVLFPQLMCKSEGWGNPTSYIQFSNLSKYWDMQVFWVDEEGAFILRKTIIGGDKHVELTCPQHVWVILAIANVAAAKRNQLAELTDEAAAELRKAAKLGGVGSDAWLALEERMNYGNLLLAVKPCVTSLLADRCTNMVWIPWNSISVSQRQHPVRMPEYKLPSDRRLFDQQNGASINPNMHVQVLDIAPAKRKRFPPISAASAADPTTATSADKNDRAEINDTIK